MRVKAIVKSTLADHAVVVQTNESTQSIKINHKSSGYGSAVNGGEVLMLALATCFCNDLYREAARRGINIRALEVEASGEFNAEGESGSNFSYSANINADCGQEEIDALIAHTDQVAEVHNTLRKGISVTLRKS